MLTYVPSHSPRCLPSRDLQLSLAAFAQSTWSQPTPLILSLWSWQCCCWHRAYHSDPGTVAGAASEDGEPTLTVIFAKNLLSSKAYDPCYCFCEDREIFPFYFLYSAARGMTRLLEPSVVADQVHSAGGGNTRTRQQPAPSTPALYAQTLVKLETHCPLAWRIRNLSTGPWGPPYLTAMNSLFLLLGPNWSQDRL